VLDRLLLAGVVSSVIGGAAVAADIDVAPQSSYYPAAVTPAPYYDWTGIYVGGNIAGAWVAQNGISVTDSVTGGLLAAGQGPSLGFGGGGQLGANWQWSRSFVIGIEGDIDALSNKSSFSLADGSTQTDKTPFISTVRARVGLTADRFMWYGTFGGAWSEDQVSRSQNSGTVNGAGPGTVESANRSSMGWAVGTGLEYAFASNWTVRLEYLYAHLDGEGYTFPLSQRTTETSAEIVNQVRAGVSFKFGGGDTVGAVRARD